MSYILPEKWIRAICRVYPIAELRRLIRIADTMDRRSEDIVDGKKVALTSGDEELLQRVGEGKDIMSILRKWSRFIPDCERAYLIYICSRSEGKYYSINDREAHG